MLIAVGSQILQCRGHVACPWVFYVKWSFYIIDSATWIVCKKGVSSTAKYSQRGPWDHGHHDCDDWKPWKTNFVQDSSKTIYSVWREWIKLGFAKQFSSIVICIFFSWSISISGITPWCWTSWRQIPGARFVLRTLVSGRTCGCLNKARKTRPKTRRTE